MNAWKRGLLVGGTLIALALPTRDFALDAWRGLASERAKGMMRGIRIHQIEAVTVHC